MTEQHTTLTSPQAQDLELDAVAEPPHFPEITAADVLEAVVRAAHGASPRPGQAKLCRDVETAMRRVHRRDLSDNPEAGELAGIAGTGTGKTFAYLAPAALLAAQANERTVVATESLNLQRQIVDEDGPQIRAGLDALGLRPVSIQLLKGFSNYIDPRTTALSTLRILDAIESSLPPSRLDTKVGGKASLRLMLERSTKAIHQATLPIVEPRKEEASNGKTNTVQLTREELAEAMRDCLKGFDQAITAIGQPHLPTSITLDGSTYATDLIISALRWAISTGIVASCTGRTVADRDDYDGRVADNMWSLFTVQRSEFPSDSPVAQSCPAQLARALAAEADIIVTNHAFLSIQAAKDVPTVLSNLTIGEIRHLVIDEAHNLPAQVRSQASGELSGRALRRQVRSAERLVPAETSEEAAKLYDAGYTLAERMDEKLSKVCRRPSTDGERVVSEGENPIEGLETDLDEWLGAMRNLIQSRARTVLRTISMKKPGQDSTAQLLEIDRCRQHHARSAALQGLIDDCVNARTGYARWIEYGRGFRSERLEFALCVSAVDVRWLLRQRLYTGYLPATQEQLYAARNRKSAADGEEWLNSDTSARPTNPDNGEEPGTEGGGEGAPPAWRLGDEYPRSVICVSATLGKTFTREMGLYSEIRDYPSSFHDAYAESAAYLPRVLANNPDYIDPKEMTNDWGKFDRTKHLAWVKRAAAQLVTASGGRALILTATASNGRDIAAHLRHTLPHHITVHDQWSGQGKAVLAREFAADETSVMVATRGWMTGINIPGDTCSLIIVDRVPRNPQTAVDDARAAQLVSDGKPSFHEFDQVYGADAAVLLEQAVGRGIRSERDRVLVAVLDPRIHAGSALSTRSSASRKMYAEVLSHYGTRTGSLRVACEWLQRLRAEQAVGAGG